MTTDLGRQAWPEVDSRRTTLLVPVGSLQQHGPHLPLDTDTVIARAVADGMAAELQDAWVAPALAYGSSGEHQAFPGTISIGTEALRGVIVELVRSLTSWAERTVFVNAHGSNAAALDAALEQMRAEGHHVGWVACATEEVDLHAGLTETALMLHLRPGSVRTERAEAGNCAPLAEILPTMIEAGVRAVSPHGVLGDPAGASAEQGSAVLTALVEQALAQLAAPRDS